jgi:hypothetical protein
MSMATMQNHLIQHGRHPFFQVWKGLGDHDSFDEKWAVCATQLAMAIVERCSTLQGVKGLLVDEGIQVEQLLAHAFGREAPTLTSESTMPIENLRPTKTMVEKVQCKREMLKIVGKGATKINLEEDGPTLQNLDLNDNEDEDDPPMQNLDPSASEDVAMDNLDTLQDVCTMFYASAWCSKLVATLTLMNMCTIHGYFNKFVDEFFLYCTIFCCLWIIVHLVACMVPKH